ncbi:hypothetical protein [Heyndrickxia coagulans]|uniref:hypothetical protein n=1 Tax=Heyndrickxia coagulans TaxID=1398 RepID=UPI000317ECD7|nr:hypothetical protein [Heyndrickxia coagulans]
MGKELLNSTFSPPVLSTAYSLSGADPASPNEKTLKSEKIFHEIRALFENQNAFLRKPGQRFNDPILKI